MTPNIEKIYQLLKASELPDNQRQELLALLHFIGDDQLTAFINLFEEDASMIPIVYNLLKQKQAAVHEKDFGKLESITQEEIKQLNKKRLIAKYQNDI